MLKCLQLELCRGLALLWIGQAKCRLLGSSFILINFAQCLCVCRNFNVLFTLLTIPGSFQHANTLRMDFNFEVLRTRELCSHGRSDNHAQMVQKTTRDLEFLHEHMNIHGMVWEVTWTTRGIFLAQTHEYQVWIHSQQNSCTIPIIHLHGSNRN
jgi:hypothetical protein